MSVPYWVSRSALEHSVRKIDMDYTYRNPIWIRDFDDGFTLILGADTAGRPIEIGYVLGDKAPVIIHIMTAREKFLR